MSNSILVTGGAGFIGYHLVKKLTEDSEARVVIIDNLSNASTRRAKDWNKRVRIYEEDIRSKEAIADIIKREKVDTCIHLAAKISVPDSISDPFGTVDVNVNGTLSVLDACAKNNVSNFIFASSAAVYGYSTVLPLKETNELNPLSPYGASKISGEVLVKSFKNSRKIANAISLRFFNIYGIGQSPEYAGVITRFAERLSNGLPPLIYGNGKQTRDFIAVDDVVNAIILATEKRVSGTFNIGTGTATSINELARLMLTIFKVDLEPLYSGATEGDISDSFSDISEAKSSLNFVPHLRLYDALKRNYSHFQDAKTLKRIN